MKRPNIIIFNPDQMRADSLHHLGNEASYTPNFDSLINDGVSFENCFCQNPVCVPSRCSFLTGLYPHTNGHRTMTYLLRNGENNLFRDLKDNGYYVWASGRGDVLAGQDRKWLKACMDECSYVIGDFINDKAQPRGEKGSDTYFSFYQGVISTDKPDGISQDNDFAYTQAAVKRIKNTPKDKPLFMFLGLNNPHPPYKVEQRFLDNIDKSKLPKRIPSLKGDEGKPSMEYGLEKGLGVSGWSEDRFDNLRSVYLGMVSKTDYLFGQIKQALIEENIYDDTLIMVVSDHGDYTGDYGLVEKAQNCFPDCLTNVPMIIKPPVNQIVQTGVNDSLVEMVDLYATVLDYADVKSTHDNFSRSLKSVVEGKAKEHRKYVFAEGGRRHGETQCMESIGKKTIGISDMYDPRISLQESEGPEHTFAAMIRSDKYKYVNRLYEQDEFYVLANGESRNEINNPEYADIISEMQKQLLSLFMETTDNVPKNYDQRFADDFYISAAAAAGQPKIAVAMFAMLMKGFHMSFDQVMGKLSGFADKFKSINK